MKTIPTIVLLISAICLNAQILHLENIELKNTELNEGEYTSLYKYCNGITGRKYAEYTPEIIDFLNSCPKSVHCYRIMVQCTKEQTGEKAPRILVCDTLGIDCYYLTDIDTVKYWAMYNSVMKDIYNIGEDATIKYGETYKIEPLTEYDFNRTYSHTGKGTIEKVGQNYYYVPHEEDVFVSLLMKDSLDCGQSSDTLLLRIGITTHIIELEQFKPLSGEFYTLTGQRVLKPEKGIYFNNRKRIIVL